MKTVPNAARDFEMFGPVGLLPHGVILFCKISPSMSPRHYSGQQFQTARRFLGSEPDLRTGYLTEA